MRLAEGGRGRFGVWPGVGMVTGANTRFQGTRGAQNGLYITHLAKKLHNTYPVLTSLYPILAKNIPTLYALLRVSIVR